MARIKCLKAATSTGKSKIKIVLEIVFCVLGLTMQFVSVVSIAKLWTDRTTLTSLHLAVVFWILAYLFSKIELSRVNRDKMITESEVINGKN